MLICASRHHHIAWVSHAISALRHVNSADMLGQHDWLHQSLVDGGMLWFTDLTAPDATWIIPTTLCLVNLLNIEVQMLAACDDVI